MLRYAMYEYVMLIETQPTVEVVIIYGVSPERSIVCCITLVDCLHQ